MVRLNDQIRFPEVRVLDEDGANIGTMSSREALEKAIDLGLDLIEINGRSRPPIVKIADYGKFAYDEKKKAKNIKAKQSKTETKNVQVKVGTSDGDLILKAKNISKWLEDGHRVKLDLFLRGRIKYSGKDFLEERIKRILKLVTTVYRIADGPKKSPKGLTLFLEKGTKKDAEKMAKNSEKTVSKKDKKASPRATSGVKLKKDENK